MQKKNEKTKKMKDVSPSQMITSSKKVIFFCEINNGTFNVIREEKAKQKQNKLDTSRLGTNVTRKGEEKK